MFNVSSISMLGVRLFRSAVFTVGRIWTMAHGSMNIDQNTEYFLECISIL